MCILRIDTPVVCSAVRNPGVRICTGMGVDAAAAAAVAIVDITFAVLMLVHVIAALSVKKHFVRIRYNNIL